MPYDPKNPLSTNYTVKDLPSGFTDAHVQQLKDAGFTQRDLLQYGLMSGGPRLAPTGPVGGFTGGGGTPPSSSLIATGGQAEPTNYFTPMFRLILGSGQQQPPQATPPSAPTGATVMNPLQLKPTAPLPIQPPGPIQPGQPFAQIPQSLPQSLPQQQPLTQNVLNPIPVPVQPVQQYGSGGLVQRYQSGGPVQQLQPGVTRNAQGQVIYTDPALQTQLGLSNLTTAQQTGLGLDPYHAQALSGGAQQVGTLYQPQFLGGAALDTGAVINLPPSGTPSSKSGVAPTPGPVVGTAVPQTPQGPWLTNPSVFAKASMPVATGAQMPQGGLPFGQGKGIVQFTGDQIAANKDPTLYRVDLGTGLTQALSGGQVLRKTNEAANPTWYKTVQDAMRLGVAQPVPMMAGTPPATSAPYTPGTAFATPPAAPGYTLGSTMPQTSVPAAQTPWLAQGGMGGGGQPSAWGIPPGQGVGGVPQAFLQAHNSALADAGKAMYSHFGGDPNSASAADIANFHTQLSGAVGQYAAAGVKKAATGGLVPGRGNEDTVPALLTPGEYVIPKQQVEQLVARGALKMQSGGFVPDDQSNVPPEARRQPLTTASQQPSSSSAQSSTPQIPAGGSGLASGLARAAQTYGSSMGGGSVGGGRIGGGGGYSADTLGKLGDEGLIGSMGLGKGFGGGGGMDPKLQNALGGIGSGLTQAAQAIASSVQPWQMQQSAIPDPSQLPKYQVPTLQQTRVA